MKQKDLTPTFWENLYQNGYTGWDIGYASPPITDYVDQIEDKSLDILIPRAGNAHEAIYMHELGFEKVFVCDWAESAFEN